MLAIPGTAFATAFFKGPVNGGANNAGVEFRAKFGHGASRRCSSSAGSTSQCRRTAPNLFEGLHFEMHVNGQRKFDGKYSVPNNEPRGNGPRQVQASRRKAAGTLKLKGSFAGGCNGDTGALPWKAKRAGT